MESVGPLPMARNGQTPVSKPPYATWMKGSPSSVLRTAFSNPLLGFKAANFPPALPVALRYESSLSNVSISFVITTLCNVLPSVAGQNAFDPEDVQSESP